MVLNTTYHTTTVGIQYTIHHTLLDQEIHQHTNINHTFIDQEIRHDDSINHHTLSGQKIRLENLVDIMSLVQINTIQTTPTQSKRMGK